MVSPAAQAHDLQAFPGRLCRIVFIPFDAQKQLDVFISGKRRQQTKGLEHEPDLSAPPLGQFLIAHLHQIVPEHMHSARGRLVKTG